MCPCCPGKIHNFHNPGYANLCNLFSPLTHSINISDKVSSEQLAPAFHSVEELRRKAQEHSTQLLQNLQQQATFSSNYFSAAASLSRVASLHQVLANASGDEVNLEGGLNMDQKI